MAHNTKPSAAAAAAMDAGRSSDKILEVKNLKTHFFTAAGTVKAVDGVSFSVRRGEVVGLVGESGCGKSVSSLSIMRLIQTPPGKIVGGEILFHGEDIVKMEDSRLRSIRGGKIAVVFQDPISSLNPFFRISTQMTEMLQLHLKMNKKQARQRAIEILTAAGIPAADKRFDCYPHEFSGGMCQRVMIAMALSCNPEILIADEPTTALDVTIQAQILDLIRDLTRKTGTSVILISHSLGVVAGICDTIHVMYAGRIVESGTTDDIFENAKHPYTKALIKAVPRLNLHNGNQDRLNRERLYYIPGQPPNIVDIPSCCPFFPRCGDAIVPCKNDYPGPVDFGNGHFAYCWKLLFETSGKK